MALFVEATSVTSIIIRSLLTLVSIGITYFLVRLYQVRTRVRDVSNKYGIPILPHSFIWGHLPVMGEALKGLPSDIYGSYLPYHLIKKYPNLDQGFFYIDSWPLQNPMIAFYDPEIVAQFTTETSMPKDPQVKVEFGPLTQGGDILVMEGQEWKHWRSTFNPAFSPRNLTAIVPEIVKEALVLKQVFADEARKGATFKMENATSAFALDVTGHAVLNTELNTQTRENTMMDAFRRQIGEMAYGFHIKHYHPSHPFRVRNNTRIIDSGLIPLVKKSFNLLSPSSSSEKSNIPKNIISLAGNWYASNGQPEPTPSILSEIMPHLKLFLIAGYDTTGIVLAFTYYAIATNPEVLKSMRQEHDEVFPDRDTVAEDIVKSPALLNQLPYTTAIIKETLRLYPPVSSIRYGAPGKFLLDPRTGKQLPTEGFGLWACSWKLQTDPKYWHRPLEFLPERWTTRDPEDPLYAGPRRKNVYRPFEMGPRGCIGQELAMLEMRVALLVTGRTFKFEEGYEEGASKYRGCAAYSAALDGEITAHASGRMPMRVEVRE